MPIYMDRHDVSETVTAEHVAQLHQADLKVQDDFGCRGLTYWFDDKRKTAFCLIEAPNEQALRDMHDKAHGQVPHSIIEVDAGIVESFLGRIEDPSKKQITTLNIIDDPAFRTIMVIAKENAYPRSDDVYQSTDLLKEFYGTIRHLLTDLEGSLVQETGDHFLVSFVSVSKAVNAAFQIRTKFHEFPSNTISCKIGLSAGVPVTEKKSIFEDTINLAERICTIIPGEIIISADVAVLSGSENLSTFSEAVDIVILTPDDEIFITRFMDFIDTAWKNSDLKVGDFSMPAGLSKSQLYRKLKILTGKSLNIFLKDYRLKKALELLDKNMKNVSEIAFDTGFSSPSYFSKCFQKKYGHTPSAYLSAKA